MQHTDKYFSTFVESFFVYPLNQLIMKNILWGFLAGLVCGFLLTLIVMETKIGKDDGSEIQLVYKTLPSTAEVEKFKGLLVFTNSLPAQKYNTLGYTAVETNIFGCSYKNARYRIAEKVWQEYPAAQGIILDFETDHKCLATVITFY